MSSPAASVLVQQAERLLGSVLRAKWRLDSVLGIGGMATVYSATHRNGHRVAVKVLHAVIASDPDNVARFLREGYAANAIDHPGVVRVLDDDITDDGRPFLVIELLDGDSLDRVAKREGFISARNAIALGTAVLDVLEAAHAKGIIHRDIKPENVFVTRRGDVRLLDFGIARLAEHGMTLVGEVLGTPAFMPPEQARGHWNEVDGRSDLWAVGATLYGVMTGHPCREASSPNEALLLAMTQPVPSVAELRPDLPAELVRVIDRALSFDKHDRWPNARAFAEALRACALDVVSTATPPPPTTAVPRAPAEPVAIGATVDATRVVAEEKDEAEEKAEVAVEPPIARQPKAKEAAAKDEEDSSDADATLPLPAAAAALAPLVGLSSPSLGGDTTTLDASPFTTPRGVAHDLELEEEEEALGTRRRRRAWLLPAVVAPIVFVAVGYVWWTRAPAPVHDAAAPVEVATPVVRAPEEPKAPEPDLRTAIAAPDLKAPADTADPHHVGPPAADARPPAPAPATTSTAEGRTPPPAAPRPASDVGPRGVPAPDLGRRNRAPKPIPSAPAAPAPDLLDRR